MAQKVEVVLVDDLDGSAGPTVETLEFGLDGTLYEIDLSKKNAQKLRSVLSGYVDVARTANRSSGKAKAKRKTNGAEPKQVRQWAMEQGIEVPAHGRIPRAVSEQYAAAH